MQKTRQQVTLCSLLKRKFRLSCHEFEKATRKGLPAAGERREKKFFFLAVSFPFSRP